MSIHPKHKKKHLKTTLILLAAGRLHNPNRTEPTVRQPMTDRSESLQFGANPTDPNAGAHQLTLQQNSPLLKARSTMPRAPTNRDHPSPPTRRMVLFYYCFDPTRASRSRTRSFINDRRVVGPVGAGGFDPIRREERE